MTWHKIDEVEPPRDGRFVELYRPHHGADMIAAQIVHAVWLDDPENGRGWCWPSGIYNPLDPPDYEECLDGYMANDFTHWQPIEPPEDTQ